MDIRIISVFFLLASVFFSGGCATLSEPECRNADWYMIGMEDGMKGNLPSRVGDHRRACSKYNITPDINAYRAGHAEGTKQYCTETNGFEVGKDGKTYNSICPFDLEPAFLQGYRIGKQFYEVDREIDRASSAIYSHKDRIKKLEKEIRQKEQLLVADTTTQEERRSLLDRIKKQQREIGELEERILENEKKKAVKEDEYSRLQRQYGY